MFFGINDDKVILVFHLGKRAWPDNEKQVMIKFR